MSGGIGSPLIPMPVVEDLELNALLRIGGPPIRCSGILKAIRTLYCRAAKKPTKAKWLLDDEYEMEIDIECKGVQPWIA